MQVKVIFYILFVFFVFIPVTKSEEHYATGGNLAFMGFNNTTIYDRERGISKKLSHFSSQRSLDKSSATNYALLIGINDYINYPQLNTAINDAEEIGSLLAKRYQFKVKILKNPTRKLLINTLAKYRKIVKPNDRLLVYYAGHGVLDRQADEGYWLPVDAQSNNYANLISNYTITSLIKSVSARHVLLIADSCFSGTLTRGIKMEFNNLEFDRVSQARSRSVITSGGLEPVEDGTGEHSIFAKSLLSVLKNNHRKITTTELFYKLRRMVILNSDQTPEFADLRKAGHEGGEFVFSSQHLRPPVFSKFPQQKRFFNSVTNTALQKSRHLDNGIFRDNFSNGDNGPEMIIVPQGLFTMGDLAGRGSENETPMHQVQIDYRFALSRYEVTFSQYDKFATDTGRVLPESNGWGRGEQPVINVSWDDAVAYVQWISKKTGKKYRLPSEAEWEYAARAGTSTVYFWGNHVGDNKSNCRDCNVENQSLKTTVVGSFQENKFGLFDMLGNVQEWTNDCWNPAYNGAPYDGSTWHSGDCSQRVIRGGAWSQGVNDVRAAARNRAVANERDKVFGFRIALSME